MNEQHHGVTKVIVTVNGNRVGRELFIDQRTCLPIDRLSSKSGGPAAEDGKAEDTAKSL